MKEIPGVSELNDQEDINLSRRNILRGIAGASAALAVTNLSARPTENQESITTPESSSESTTVLKKQGNVRVMLSTR